MRLFTHRVIQGKGLAPVLLKRAAAVSLSWDVRQKSRFHATDDHGKALAVSLPRGQVIRGGDVLVGEGNELLRVLAASQPLMQVKPCALHGTAFDLVREAYHLGNRHVSLQLTPHALYLEHDPVLQDMLLRMHLDVTLLDAAFEPESGAYAASSAHGHAHGHVHTHDHEQDPGHDHTHGHDHVHPTHRHD